MTEHTTRIQTVKVAFTGNKHRFVCSCGERSLLDPDNREAKRAAREHTEAAEEGGPDAPAIAAEPRMPARCHSCSTVYDLARVTVTARYSDCSMWRCPGCGIAADDRMAWSGPDWKRMGYDDLKIKADAERKRASASQPEWRTP